MNPYENRPALEKQETGGFESPSVQSFYENQESSFFPGASRPAPQMPSMGMPQHTSPAYQQQPYPYVQQAPQYQAPGAPAYQQSPQQASQAEKDDLGVPAYLRRSVKK